MEREEVKNLLVEIAVDKLECKENALKDNTRFNDLGADSLDQIELLMEVEREFGIYISDEEALRVITFGDAVELVCQKVEAL